jgi:hypothetical protein
MKKIIFYVLILAIGFVLGVLFQKRPADQKFETTVQSDASQAAADVKTDTKKAESEIKNK